MKLIIVTALHFLVATCVFVTGVTSTSASASASSAEKVPSQSQQYFPDAPITIDMAILSDAVYHLKNKVQSCHDEQSTNKTLINSLQDEMLSWSWREGFNHLFHHRMSNHHRDGGSIYQLLLPEGVECLHYSHDHSLGTQVLVVRSIARKYVAVVYAGTDDWKTTLMDGEILMSEFGPGVNSHIPANNNDLGPMFQGVPDGVKVHRGFNSAVFDDEDFRTVLDCISSARLGGDCDDNNVSAETGAGGGANMDGTPSPTTPYELITTGHSLGAADAVLLGATLHLQYPNENITSINFGCPKVGNTEFSVWMNSLQSDQGGQMISSSADNSDSNKDSGSFEIFRFVNKVDLVPRLPELLFKHVGHTLQMSIGGEIKAYYDHLGNENLGYSGVPFGWDAAPWALFPFAVAAHVSTHYIEFLADYQPSLNSNSNNTSTIIRGFERVEDDAEPSSVA
mmetsp:Transcript_29185/g.62858  ORF Transcript_29185/g.62858 Transcript_29185/m.62858 type:complete len:452 (+) Transcript_29185:176-1531(+)